MNQSQNAQNITANRVMTLPAICSAVMLWLSFPFVSLSAKCFLTEKCAFHYHGSEFSHPLSAAALHLLLVGSILFIVEGVSFLFWRQGRHGHYRFHNDDATEDPPLSLQKMIQLCVPVGLAFGCKYVVGHYALQVTPTPIYELFHCLNLVFVTVFAHLVLNERLQTCGEFVCIAGVVIGSGLAGYEGLLQSKTLDSNNDSVISWLALVLNILNGMLAGAVVVLLRTTVLQCQGRVAQVTCLKMLLGAACLVPFALWMEQEAIFHLTGYQVVWLLISSGAILIYHVNLALLCYLATDAPTVAIVESLRPIPAFVLLACLQAMTPKSAGFWVGSVVVLVSAVCFQLSRKFSQPRLSVSRSPASASIKQAKQDAFCRKSETPTEVTTLLWEEEQEEVESIEQEETETLYSNV